MGGFEGARSPCPEREEAEESEGVAGFGAEGRQSEEVRLLIGWFRGFGMAPEAG